MFKKYIKFLPPIILSIVVLFVGFTIYKNITKLSRENTVLKKVISRLEADSRVAEVLVTKVQYDEIKKKSFTTIKFLEFDVDGNPLEPKYFTFSGNIIQFQAYVIRFKDIHIRKADKIRSKSVFLFRKVFMLDGQNTQEYDITSEYQVPDGYKIVDSQDSYENTIWKQFWEYALDPKKAQQLGIKNAQIEAPGTMFIPGILYTLKIEHDGGLRIDSNPLPQILKGEKIPK